MPDTIQSDKYPAGPASLFAATARSLPRRIFKQWKDTPEKLAAEGQPVGWFETTLEECIEHTEGAGYWTTGSVTKIFKSGLQVYTPFALYKMEA